MSQLAVEKGRPSLGRVVQLKLPEKMLRALDIAWRKLGYSDRSDIIRAAIREFLEKRGFKIEEA